MENILIVADRATISDESSFPACSLGQYIYTLNELGYKLTVLTKEAIPGNIRSTLLKPMNVTTIDFDPDLNERIPKNISKLIESAGFIIYLSPTIETMFGRVLHQANRESLKVLNVERMRSVQLLRKSKMKEALNDPNISDLLDIDVQYKILKVEDFGDQSGILAAELLSMYRSDLVLFQNDFEMNLAQESFEVPSVGQISLIQDNHDSDQLLASFTKEFSPFEETPAFLRKKNIFCFCSSNCSITQQQFVRFAREVFPKLQEEIKQITNGEVATLDIFSDRGSLYTLRREIEDVQGINVLGEIPDWNLLNGYRCGVLPYLWTELDARNILFHSWNNCTPVSMTMCMSEGRFPSSPPSITTFLPHLYSIPQSSYQLTLNSIEVLKDNLDLDRCKARLEKMLCEGAVGLALKRAGRLTWNKAWSR